jgi:hypothetical protein
MPNLNEMNINCLFLTIAVTLLFISWRATDKNQLTDKHRGYTIFHSVNDKRHLNYFKNLVEKV